VTSFDHRQAVAVSLAKLKEASYSGEVEGCNIEEVFRKGNRVG
jgi:hypothetical protein